MRMRLISRAMLAGVAMLLSASFALAQPAELKLPEGLRHVPPDALGFVHVRVGAFLQSPVAQDLLKQMRKDRDASSGLKKIEETLGVAVADLESVTLVMLPAPANLPKVYTAPMFKEERPPMVEPRRDEKKFEFEKKREFEKPPVKDKEKFEEKKVNAALSPVLFQERFEQPAPADESGAALEYLASVGPVMIVTSAKPIERKKILKAQLMSDGRGDFFGPTGRLSVLFLSDRSVMLGDGTELARYAELTARKSGPKSRPMDKALALAAKPHMVVAGGYLPPALRRQLPARLAPDPRLFAPLTPLLLSEAALALDLGKSLDLTLVLHAPTEASAGQALQAVKNVLALAEMALASPVGGGPAGSWQVDLQKGLAKALADARLEQKGTTVTAQLKLDVNPELVQRAIQDGVASIQKNAARTQSVNNLKQIGLAMHSYHDAYKFLPPAGLSNVNDPKGKPLLSWRVEILPFIDQAPLYNQFDLTLPWDHPTNKKLIPLMPKVYVLPGAETKEKGLTHYRVLVGPQTMFEPGQKITLVGVTDGTSNTIMAVEAKEPTIWTRPDDLPFDPKGPLPKFGVSPDGFLAVFGDGLVHFIRAGTPPERIRAYITRNGDEVVPFPD